MINFIYANDLFQQIEIELKNSIPDFLLNDIKIKQINNKENIQEIVVENNNYIYYVYYLNNYYILGKAYRKNNLLETFQKQINLINQNISIQDQNQSIELNTNSLIKLINQNEKFIILNNNNNEYQNKLYLYDPLIHEKLENKNFNIHYLYIPTSQNSLYCIAHLFKNSNFNCKTDEIDKEIDIDKEYLTLIENIFTNYSIKLPTLLNYNLKD